MLTPVAQRLANLGVQAEFHAGLEGRQAPRYHVIVHLMIILASIAAAVVAIATWSRYVDVSARTAADAAHALLYASDIGAGSLGFLLAILLAAGWLCAAITWKRGRESARNGWAADLAHEPAKNKAATDWLWREMIRRHTRSATNADDFLDSLSKGMLRDLGLAALAMLLLAIALGTAFPARISYATSREVVDQPLLPLASPSHHDITSATTVVLGCPDLPKSGNELVYRLNFADGSQANLGDWKPVGDDRLAALESVATQLGSGVARQRFTNPIQSNPMATECLAEFGGHDTDGAKRLTHLLAVP